MKAYLSSVALALIALCHQARGAGVDEARAFDIPAGTAELGITEFSQQAHRQIIAPGDALIGIKTSAVRGAYPPSAALTLLLKDTDLVVASDDGRTIVLKRRVVVPAPEKGEPSDSLAKMANEAIVISGYRASLVNATEAKRDAIGLTDAIFAEDIGKFPDSNLAESLNRVPGIILTRDANGEGVLIAIRGLSTNFTRILLNGAPISVATGGVIDSGNTNREVDLNMFPGELFTSLTVEKTPRADVTEGGAAGVVNMRSRRPFETPGFHVTYVAQGIDNTQTAGMGANGALIVSNTWTSGVLGQIGVLIGVAGQHSYRMTKGWEDGNAGWVTPSITNITQCGAPTGCDLPGSTVSIGGNSITIAPTIPANVAIPGYAPGAAVDASMLMALNPGLDMTRFSNMLIPRLPREMYQLGSRDRINAVASIEALPNENLHFTLDMIFGRRINNLDRSALSWGVRAGNGAQPMIPMNVVLDQNGVITSGQFANAQFGLEARPYVEKSDFFSLNPGINWRVSDLLTIDVQINASRSHYGQESPTIYLATCPSGGNPPGIPGCSAPSGGVFVDFTNHRGVPDITTNIDLDDPANFQWNGGRAQIRSEKRYTTTYGARLDFSYGDERAKLKFGAAYDVQYRSIMALDFLDSWQRDVCGDGASNACTGAADSLVPQSRLTNYLYRGPDDFVAVDYHAFKTASAYYRLEGPALANLRHGCIFQPAGNQFTPSGVTGATSGCLDERTFALHVQLDGEAHLAGHSLKYDIGLRGVTTRQSIRSPVKRTDGSYDFSNAVHDYQAVLPVASVAYEIADDIILRSSLSRTMTRANASQIIAVVNFADVTAQEAAVGNPSLKPYFSNNVDLGAEWYTGGEGYIGVELFGKWIGGFTTQKIVARPFSDLAQYGITWSTLTSVQQQALFDRSGCTSDAHCPAVVSFEEPLNSPGIEAIRGLELSYVQPLDFLLGRYGLPGFGVTGNLTVIGQSSSGSAATHALGVAPYTFNVTGYYEYGGVMAHLTYSFIDKTYGSSSNQQNVCLPTILAADAGCPQGAYLFSAPYAQADFSSGLKLSRLFGEIASDPEINVSIQNVFDAKRHSYFQYTNAYHTQYQPGRTFLVGVHGTF